jgi:hypothetical protein
VKARAKSFTFDRRPVAKGLAAERDGARLVLEPSGVEFYLPQPWVDEFEEGRHNIYVSPGALEHARHNSFEWREVHSVVLESLVPFDRCVVHAGPCAWDSDGTHCPASDLYLRVYDLNGSPEGIEKSLVTKAEADLDSVLREIKGLGAWRIRKRGTYYGSWRESVVVTVNCFYVDHGGEAMLDFRLLGHNGSTLVCVFMYIGGHNPKAESIDAEIIGILNSFASTAS